MSDYEEREAKYRRLDVPELLDDLTDDELATFTVPERLIWDNWQPPTEKTPDA